MSIHRSLKTADTMKRHRSVLSRLERVKILQEKGAWNPGEASVLGLPKVKHLKIRVKKEKSAAAPTAGTAAPEAAGAASSKLLSRDVPQRGASSKLLSRDVPQRGASPKLLSRDVPQRGASSEAKK